MFDNAIIHIAAKNEMLNFHSNSPTTVGYAKYNAAVATACTIPNTIMQDEHCLIFTLSSLCTLELKVGDMHNDNKLKQATDIVTEAAQYKIT